MVQLIEKPQVGYFAQLLKQIDRPSPSLNWEWLQTTRQKSRDLVEQLAFPTTRDEAWRFTDISPLLGLNFADANHPKSFCVTSLNLLTLPEAEQSRLVFVNGFYSPDCSSVKRIPEGVFVGSLSHLLPTLESQGITAEKISQYLTKQPGGEEVFTSLNTANIDDVAIVWVKKGIQVDTPIHLLFVSLIGEQTIITQPRCLVVAEPGSKVTIIEHYGTSNIGCPDGLNTCTYFNNPVTEIWVEENAHVNHTRIQRDAGDAFHIGKNAISQARSSHYTGNAISLGSSLSRHHWEIFQTGEGTETILNGLTLIGREQLADTHSSIELNYPNGMSRQLNKCIIEDKAHGVFNGRITVKKRAQMTDAGQLSRNLLMSPKARVDTKPQLEIIADNVKCSHGATVSQLDEDAMFYLQSRGLDNYTSRHLLIDAFAGEILNQLPLESVHQMLARCVSCRT